MPIEFNGLLEEYGVDLERTRLVRHHDTRRECLHSPFSLWRTDRTLFERYQSIQGRPKFRGSTHIASFVKTPLDETLFVGMYRVVGVGRAPAGTIDPATEHDCEGFILYTLERYEALSDFIGRMTIDWGNNFRVWVQKADTQIKNVSEIRNSFDELPFPG